MAKISKCFNCDIELIDKEDKFKYGNKTYCKKCYDEKNNEKTQYNLLLQVICDYYNIDIPTGFILKQLKTFKETYNYTYSGIGYCLWYCKEIKNAKFDSKYGISIVQYEYENAKMYYLQQQNIKQSVTENTNKSKTINVKMKCKNNTENYLIDIDNLLRE